MRRSLFAGAVMAIVGAAVGTAFSQWSFVDDLNVSRSGVATAVAPDGTIYSMGGNVIGDPDMTDVTEAYDRAADLWTVRAPMPTLRTALAAAATKKGKIYVFGGSPESHGYGSLTTVEIYDPATDTWTTGEPMPTARTGHKAVTGPDGRIYLIGGYSLDHGGHLNVLEIYDPAANTWTTGSPMPTARQQFGAALGANGKIYVIGGSDEWRSGIMTTVEIYDTATDSWSVGSPMPTPRDGLGAAAAKDGLIYAVGGWTGNYPFSGMVTDLVEIYNPATDTWQTGPRLLSPTYGPGAVAGSDCRIYVVGGGGYSTSPLVQRYSPPTSRRSGKCG